MTLSSLQKNALEYILRTNGFHIERETEPSWVAADATFAPGRCFLAYDMENQDRVVAATSLQQVAQALIDEGHQPIAGLKLPNEAVQAYTAESQEQAHKLVRRLFQLSKSLPTAPLDTYRQKTRALPVTTEAERTVIQRIGQDIFREALLDFWSGQCAVTGLDQPELLRASHMKPWAACASDDERLDPFNGLLLAVHWDSAFDCGLVSFDNDGRALFSSALTSAARALLDANVTRSKPGFSIRPEHLPYLQHHREHIWQK